MLPFHFVSIVVVEVNIFLNVVITSINYIYVYIVATYSFNFFSVGLVRQHGSRVQFPTTNHFYNPKPSLATLVPKLSPMNTSRNCQIRNLHVCPNILGLKFVDLNIPLKVIIDNCRRDKPTIFHICMSNGQCMQLPTDDSFNITFNKLLTSN